ncbi:MAG: hypothetical protein R3245_00945 [Kiloniellales bacterium]|nr:hypothetical protein [Kiloniellales bacterium]
MYRDNSLLPNEAIRLMALGILAENPTPYDRLSAEVRNFAGRITGPALELVGAPLEVLKVEGLVAAEGPRGQASQHDDDALLRITEKGRLELTKLLSSNIRAPANQLGKLIIAIKIRFLHLLPPEEQLLQAEMLVEISERELARLTDLRAAHGKVEGHLLAWLDMEVSQVQERVTWFNALLAKLTGGADPGPPD